MKIGDLVEIVWDDAYGENEGWVNIEDLDEFDIECKSVGYFVRQTDRYVVLTSTFGLNSHEQVCGVTIVPNGFITSLEVLKEHNRPGEHPEDSSPHEGEPSTGCLQAPSRYNTPPPVVRSGNE